MSFPFAHNISQNYQNKLSLLISVIVSFHFDKSCELASGDSSTLEMVTDQGGRVDIVCLSLV